MANPTPSSPASNPPPELARLQRLYAALVSINQAIVRANDQATLFERVTEILVLAGGFRMAWIGWNDPQTHRLAPIARFGDELGYLDTIRIYTDDRPEGQGPSGVAFRENRPYICNDIFADPSTVPWRADAQLRGYRASAVFPIAQSGAPVGTLNVYADQVGFFLAEEIALIKQAASDLSFALTRLAAEQERARIAAVVEQEREFARTLLESMPGVLYLYDQQGRFLRWNRNFEQVSGYSGAEIAGMHPLQFFSSEERGLLESRIGEVFERGAASVEANFVTKDGRSIPHLFTGRRLNFEDQPCLLGVGIDISKRRQAQVDLQKSEERFRSTLDGLMEGGQLLSFDWRYLYLNKAAATQNRRPNSELLGRTMLECWPGIEGTPVFALLSRVMQERTPQRGEVEFTFPDGVKGWFEIRAQPVPEGVFLLSVDVSQRKQAELALRELNDNLERKVAERTRDLEAARLRAESADRLKSAFLATMSHELRTPLNSIIGFTGIILQGLAGPLNQEQQKQLGMVQGSARHLLELINDVLDLSKIEAGQLEIHSATFDVAASIARVMATVKPLADKKGLTLRLELGAEELPFDSDRRRFEQIVINLANNAIKFTDHGAITIKAHLERPGHAPPRLNLEVADTGIGIKAEDLKRLFLPFSQLDSGLGRQHEGTGLGLAICRRLAELLGGNISAASSPGAGSTFRISLPHGAQRTQP